MWICSKAPLCPTDASPMHPFEKDDHNNAPSALGTKSAFPWNDQGKLDATMKSVALFALLVANTNALSGYWIPPLDTPGLDCEYKQIKVPGAGEFVCLELESSICRDNKGYFGKWWFGVGQPKPEDAGICDPETTYPIIYDPATKTYPITGTSIVDNDGNVCLDNNGEAITDCNYGGTTHICIGENIEADPNRYSDERPYMFFYNEKTQQFLYQLVCDGIGTEGKTPMIKMVNNEDVPQYADYPIDIVKAKKGFTNDPNDTNELWKVIMDWNGYEDPATRQIGKLTPFIKVAHQKFCTEYVGATDKVCWEVGSDCSDVTTSHDPIYSVCPDNSRFNMQLVQIGDVDPLIKQIFEDSKAFWERIITNNLPAVFNTAPDPVDFFAGVFPGNENFQPLVDDIVIGYEVASIDGPGSILGQAGPTYVRLAPNNGPDPSFGFAPFYAAPYAGVMFFDEDDFKIGGPLNFTEADLRFIILHEMGHALGLGILDCTGAVRLFQCDDGLNPPLSSSPYAYTCPNAIREFNNLDSQFTLPPLRMENEDPRPGSACAHWELDAFVSDTSYELMTGFLQSNKYVSLSAVTVGGADDIFGYEVDYSAADPFPNSGSGNRIGAPSSDDGLFTTIDLDISSVIKDVIPVGLQRWGAIVDSPQI